MNLLDFFILLPIGFFAYRGFMNGLIKEVLSIAGIILGVIITFKYMHPASSVISSLFTNLDHAVLIAGIFLFIATVAGVQFIAYISQKFLEFIKINFINRLAGLLFGTIKSGIVVSTFLLLLAGFNLPGETSRSNSVSYPYVIYLAPVVFDMAGAIYPGAENFIETIDRTIQENNPIKNLPIFEPKE